MLPIMYNAYQKYYSALKNFERLSGECSFWDNISSIDSFVSEFRSITFVLQKSIGKDEEKKKIYEATRDKYLGECKWVNELRTQVIHQKPVELIKQLTIMEYKPYSGEVIEQKKYTASNDESFELVEERLRKKWIKKDAVEIFFSMKISFFNEGEKEDLFPKMMVSIDKMDSFMSELYQRYDEKDDLCEKLRIQCMKLVAKDSLDIRRSVWDYIYYPQKDLFDRASLETMILGSKARRLPTKSFTENRFLELGHGLFQKFALLNALMKRMDLMPTFLCVYKDNTCTLDSINSSIKTTYYRIFNEIADKILEGEVVEVIIMTIYSTVMFDENVLRKTSRERSNDSKSDIMVFSHMTKEIQEEIDIIENDFFDSASLSFKITHPMEELALSKINMTPIINAFKSICNI